MNTTEFFDRFGNKNHKSLAKLIARLYEYRESLLVIRLDLGYLAEYSNRLPLEIAQKHRAKLLNSRRENAFFNHLLGYAWSVDRGEFSDSIGGTGFHHHFVFFFDGYLCNLAQCIGAEIAQYFQSEITPGYGYAKHFNGRDIAEVGFLGTSLIHRNDIVRRNQLLEFVAADLTKAQPIPGVRSGLSATGEYRAFGRSKLWKPMREM